MSTKNHKTNTPKKLQIAILTLSSTRTLSDDQGGNWIEETAQKEGHDVIFHQVIKDDHDLIVKAILEVISKFHPHAAILTGGTGISSKDVTIEAIKPLFEKEMTAFGHLFAYLSFEEIDSSAILSRATAGIIQKTAVFCIPGSLNACKLACKNIIFPELGHIVKHIYD